MPQIRQDYLDHELRCWMRPDWRKFWRPGYESDPLYKEFERIERKFSPEQPRVPAGVSEGGRWTSSTGGAGSATRFAPSEDRPGTANGRISRQVVLDCDAMHRQDLFVCRAVQMRTCYEQAYLRLSNCQNGRPIPPLNF